MPKPLKMQPQIKTINPKKLIGQNLPMTFATNKTFELWRQFMPRRKEITTAVSSDLFSMQVYDDSLVLKILTQISPFKNGLL